MVVQYAEKFEVFKRQTQSQRELVDSAILQLHRSLEALGKRPPGEQETTPQKDSQNSPAQPNPNGNKAF